MPAAPKSAPGRSSATNGRNVTLVEYGQGGAKIGRFCQFDDSIWIEENPGNSFTFEEIGRDDGSVYHEDRNRNVSIQLDLHTKEVKDAPTRKTSLPSSAC